MQNFTLTMPVLVWLQKEFAKFWEALQWKKSHSVSEDLGSNSSLSIYEPYNVEPFTWTLNFICKAKYPPNLFIQKVFVDDLLHASPAFTE